MVLNILLYITREKVSSSIFDMVLDILLYATEKVCIKSINNK